jgi:hypothetical protein
MNLYSTWYEIGKDLWNFVRFSTTCFPFVLTTHKVDAFMFHKTAEIKTDWKSIRKETEVPEELCNGDICVAGRRVT